MALLCRQHDPPWLFVHIYRTGGNTVRRAFRADGIPTQEIGEGHCAAQDARWLIADEGLWRALVKFAFIRNPYDWMLSLYSYIQRAKQHELHQTAKEIPFNEWLAYYFKEVFNHNTGKLVGQNKHLSQTDFIRDADGGRLVTVFGPPAPLQFNFDLIRERLHLPPRQLEWWNSSIGINRLSDWRSAYTDAGRDLVREYLAQDFKMFGFDQ